MAGSDFKGTLANFRDDEEVHHLNCGDSFMGVCKCRNASNCAIYYISIIPQYSWGNRERERERELPIV